MNIEDLEAVFLKAKEDGLDVCVEIKMPGQDNELIINHCSSIDNKLAYYKNAYNEDLTHKSNSDIKIVGVSSMKFF